MNRRAEKAKIRNIPKKNKTIDATYTNNTDKPQNVSISLTVSNKKGLTRRERRKNKRHAETNHSRLV